MRIAGRGRDGEAELRLSIGTAPTLPVGDSGAGDVGARTRFRGIVFGCSIGICDQRVDMHHDLRH